MFKSSVFFACSLFASFLVPAAEAVAQISVRSPSGTVELLTEKQRAYLALPRDARVKAGSNAVFRAEMSHFGLKPVPVMLEWRYADRESRPADLFRIEILRAKDGKRVWRGEAQKGPRLRCDGNLEVDTDYRCRFEAVRDGAVVATAESRFRTADRAPRLLKVEGMRNFRDLGGRRGLDGRRVRQGLVYRSHGLNENARHKKGEPSVTGKSYLTPASLRYLVETLGIRTDLDLRADQETWGMTGSPLGPEVRWVHVSSEAYHALLSEKGRAAFTECFRLFLDDGNYPIVFHCMAGADRTGSLAFVLNGLLGVEEEELWKDWEAHMWVDANPDFRHQWRMESLSRDFNGFPGESFADKCESFVLSCGFTKADVARFHEKMLER